MIQGIVILGMHRGGTSATAEVVHRWGAYGGPEGVQGLIKANRWNPRGYWEYKQFVSLNEELLAAAGYQWDCPPGHDEEEILAELATSGPYAEKAHHLLDHLSKPGHIWFLKDPRASVLLPFWQRILPEVAYVIPVRHPLEVALSLNRRNQMNFWAALLLWHQYMMSVLRYTQDTPARILVSYTSLTENPRPQCIRLASALDEYTARPASDARRQAMVKAVAQGLKRHIHEDQYGFDLSEQLFKRLDRLAISGEAWPDFSPYQLGPTWRKELLSLSQCGSAVPRDDEDETPEVLLERAGL